MLRESPAKKFMRLNEEKKMRLEQSRLIIGKAGEEVASLIRATFLTHESIDTLSTLRQWYKQVGKVKVRYVHDCNRGCAHLEYTRTRVVCTDAESRPTNE